MYGLVQFNFSFKLFRKFLLDNKEREKTFLKNLTKNCKRNSSRNSIKNFWRIPRKQFHKKKLQKCLQKKLLENYQESSKDSKTNYLRIPKTNTWSFSVRNPRKNPSKNFWRISEILGVFWPCSFWCAISEGFSRNNARRHFLIHFKKDSEKIP